MVYGIAQRHGADVHIESTVGQGTTVSLSFPIANTAEAQPHLLELAQRTSKAMSVLVIDDDPIVLKSVSDTLEADGHAVVKADGGQAGIAAFVEANRAARPFDIVFTDLGMPYVDGRQVARAIKQISEATPVVLLTGWGQRMIAEGSEPAHIDRVLSKPPKLRELRLALLQLVQRSKPHEQRIPADGDPT
jgi:CheY-like chemotaxis protein